MPAVVAPINTVTLGGIDISAEVGAPLGGTSVSWEAGANFNGTSESPGRAVVVCRNDAKKFNPDNNGSPYASVLRINKLLRISSVFGGTTYRNFHGYVTRIVPRDDKFTEIHASDPLWRFTRMEVSVSASVSRQLQAFRGLILNEMEVAGGERSLAAENGPESMIPFTGVDQVNGLSLLEEINTATGSFHFIRPTTASYQYVVRDRLYLQSNAVAETYQASDYTKPFPVIGNADEIAENIINEQRVRASPRLLNDVPEIIWELRHPINVNPNTTRVIWARWDDPAFMVTMPGAERVVSTNGAAPTISITPYSRSARIEIITGPNDVDRAKVRSLVIRGTLAPSADISSVTAQNGTSISDYGLFRGSEISSDYISSRANARGLASWYVRRYRNPRPRPTMQVQNRFPSQLSLEIGNRIALVYPEYNWGGGNAKEFLIRGYRTSVSGSGNLWTTDYHLEHAPDLEDLFTIGGTAAQGIGGTGIMGY